MLGIDSQGTSFTVTPETVDSVLSLKTPAPPAPITGNFAQQYQQLYAQLRHTAYTYQDAPRRLLVIRATYWGDMADKSGLLESVSYLDAQEYRKDFIEAVSQRLGLNDCAGCIYYRRLFGESKADIAEISERTAISHQTVFKMTKILSDAGLIHIEQQRDARGLLMANRYSIPGAAAANYII